MNRFLKGTLSLGAVFLLSGTAAAAAPYSSYTYDYWGNPVSGPQAYLPHTVIDGDALGAGPLNSPADLFVDREGNIYLLDAGNNRVLVLDGEYRLTRTIDGFRNGAQADAFNKPQGLFVDAGGHLFIADTENSRIVELDASGALVRILGVPESDLFEDMVYKPMKLVLDRAGRFYVVAQNVNKGLLELDMDGGLTGYFGANKVIPNMADYFWKMIAPEAVRKKLVDFVPTEYNNIMIDREGFLYVTTSALDISEVRSAISSRRKDDKAAMIRKLNPTGTDVLRRYGIYPPVGDILVPDSLGFSALCDISVEDSGIYSVLDSKRGRVFTYDSDGNLMYIFGSTGGSEGNFKRPAAMASGQGGDILVLDGQLNNLTVFRITEYGGLLKSAVTLHYQGDYEESAEKWEQVLRSNINCDLAYIGMGKAMLRQDEYREAMNYFRLGDSRDYYVRALKLYRKEFIARNSNYLLIGAALLVLGACVSVKAVKRGRKGVKK